MAKQGKRLRNAYKGLTSSLYKLCDGIQAVKKFAGARFDETVEIAINLNLDPRKSDQHLRGVVQLPGGTGKTLRVAVFARDAKATEALEAGADIVGAEDLSEKVLAGQMDFDRCIATPDMMGVVGRLGRALGPKGLMPNPKLGTVTMDVAAAIQAAKGGQVEYRTDKGGIVHAGVGKASFDIDTLKDNIRAFVMGILKARPSGIKGLYIKRIHLSSSMGPSVSLDVSEMLELVN